MSEKKRLHPISVIANIVKQLKDAFFPLVLLIIVRNKTISTMWDIAVPSAVVMYTIVTGIVSWFRFTYRFEEGELRIEHGVLVRKKRYIPFERIQGVSISEGFLQRLAGVVKVNIETAGNKLGEAEVVLTAVTREEAERIQRWIRKAKEMMNVETMLLNENAASSFVSVHQPLQKEPKNIIFSMNFWEVFQVAVTSGGALSVIAAIFVFVSQFDNLIPYERLYKDAQTMLFAHGLFYMIIAVLLIFIAAYMISIIQNMLRYAFFTVEKIDENIIISRGLLERRKVTTPVARVQGIVIKENMIRRWLGYASVYIIHAGGALDGGRHGNIILCPLIKKERIASVISSCFPEYSIDHEFNALPKRACIRYMARPLYVLILPVCIAAYFLRPWGLLLLLLLPIVSYFGYLSYKEAGWAISPHQLALRSGLFNVKAMYMLKNRIQSMEASSNWFQKRKRLGTIAATVMPGIGARGEVADLDQEDVKTIYAWLKRTNEASKVSSD